MQSKALEVNLACTRVDVTVSERYDPLRAVVAGYHGLAERLDAFLREVCHPYRNWGYVVQEARKLALDTLHLMRGHPRGVDAAALFVDIWLEAALETTLGEVRKDAADNLLLFLGKAAGEGASGFRPVLNEAFERVSCLEEVPFQAFVRSYYEIGRLADDLLESVSEEKGFLALNRLLVRCRRTAYQHWLSEEDPLGWFRGKAALEGHPSEGELEAVFHPVSHESVRERLEEVERMGEGDPDSRGLCRGLAGLPGFRFFVGAYEGIPRALKGLGRSEAEGERWRLLFHFHIMELEGLSALHEDTLRAIHRTMAALLERGEREEAEGALQSAFSVLRWSIRSYPSTALNSVLNIGKAVYATGRRRLIAHFVERVADLHFQGPDLAEGGEGLLNRRNTDHVLNIRVWMQLIGLDPPASRKLLSALTIHLALRGVFIRDTDLFPREVTRFLNSNLGPVYHQAKPLARLLPTYFNEIGAEGRLRDVSTEVDEMTGRQDPLVHFVRKQSHVESSNRIVGLVEGMLSYWWSGRREPLEPYLPAPLYERLGGKEAFPEGIHRILEGLAREGKAGRVEDLLGLESGEIARAASGLDGVSATDPERLRLAVELYQLLYRKYRLGAAALEGTLDQLPPGILPDVDGLRGALREPDLRARIAGILDALESLRDLILSGEAHEAQEDIYHKRHIAADIPSVYGSYHEAKFDAMGLTLRLESLLNTLLEELAASSDLSLVTRATMARARSDLELMVRALRVDGIQSSGLESNLDLLARALEVRGFSFGQFVDVFRGLEDAVRNLVQAEFTNVHQQNLESIVSSLAPEDLLPRYRPPEGGADSRRTLVDRAAEIFLRERIAATPGLQPLDRLVGRIAETLSREAQRLPEDSLRTLLDFDPDRAVTPIHPVLEAVEDPIYLGKKALNLVALRELGFPVPPGFVVTTEVFRCRGVIDAYLPAAEQLRARVNEEIARLERETGKGYGDPENPLLLSVRSGAAVSQPGMMETVLNVGISGEVAASMARRSGSPWFAWDCYRRFLQSYGMAFGINRDLFDDLIQEHKERAGVARKADLAPGEMEALAHAYRELVERQGVEVVLDPLEQLHVVIGKVFDSWNGSRAASYRRILGISDAWGTAVTVQQMVYGNRSRRSGAGVAFTHSPRYPSEGPLPWGDYTAGNQGEDMVSGLVNAFPLTRRQAELENRREQPSLEEAFPDVFDALMGWVERLVVDKGWGPQDMEFTFQGDRAEDLYILQTRDLHMRAVEKIPSFRLDEEARGRIIGRGVGAGGGAMSGRAVYNLEEIHGWRREEPDTSLILIRGDTVPDDIEEIHAADGLLTARGGATSHAAIVAHRLGKTCVVGLSELACDEKRSACSIGGLRFQAGERLSIDGREGSVYAGPIGVLGNDVHHPE
jgi:pyruvate,orthophosphate dikinase